MGVIVESVIASHFQEKGTSNKTGKAYVLHGVELESGERFYSGFKKFDKAGPGDEVSFEYNDVYGKPQIDQGTVKVGALSKAERAVFQQRNKAGVSGSNVRTPVGKVFPVPSDHGDRSIIRQNSLGHAVDVVITVIRDLKLEKDPSITCLDDVIELVIDTAYTFEEYSSGQREVRKAQEIISADQEEND